MAATMAAAHRATLAQAAVVALPTYASMALRSLTGYLSQPVAAVVVVVAAKPAQCTAAMADLVMLMASRELMPLPAAVSQEVVQVVMPSVVVQA